MREYDIQQLKAEVQDGVRQVDDTLNVTDIDCTYDKNKRVLSINFTASNAEEEIDVSTEMG